MRFRSTDRVRKVLARAVEEAVRLGHDYRGTEHILLGLVGQPGLALKVLEELGVAPGDVRERISQAVRPGEAPGSGPIGERVFTSLAKRVLELSMAEAREAGAECADTEHLLLGLLREKRGIAARVLRDLGLTVPGTRQAVMRLRDAPRPPDASATPGVGEVEDFRIGIDDTSSASIYEQIVTQVREGVATGALRPGGRLPSVRRLADQLDIAPGTVARAYGELEQLEVVVTEGARGTRVADARRDGPPEPERREALVGLLRPVAVAAFHMGATARDLRDALEPAMEGIL